MILATLFGKLLKIWVVIRGDAIFLLFLDCSAELVVLCNASFSHQVKFYSFVFMHNISTLVVCVNGKHPWSLPFFPLRSLHRPISSIQTPDTGNCRYPIHDKKNMTCPWEGSSIARVSRSWCTCFSGYIEKLKFSEGRISRVLKESTQYIRQKLLLPQREIFRTIYSEIDLRCLKSP